MKLLATLLIVFVNALPVFPQATSDQTTPATSQPAATTQPASGGTAPQTPAPGGSGQSGAQASGPQPVPYSPDEFPAWSRDLRRFEIISIGAFPVALLVSSASFQLVRYAQSGFSQAYVPAVLGSGATPLSAQEKIRVLVAGVGLSLAVGLTDYILGRMKAENANAAAGPGTVGVTPNQTNRPNTGPNR